MNLLNKLLIISAIFVSVSTYGQENHPCIFASESQVLEIDLEAARKMAISSNIALKIEEINPEISKTDIEKEKARFDPVVSANFSGTERISKVIFQQGDMGQNVTNRTDAGIAIRRISHSGTLTEFDVTTIRTRSARSDNLFSTRFGVNIEHPLKKGAGRAVNLVSLRQAELDLQWSEHELQGFVLNLIAQTENRYWDYYLSTRQLEIMQESYHLAEQQREETQKRIESGSIPESEAAAAEAEVTLRKVDLINAQSRADRAAVAFLRTINPDTEDFWVKKPVLNDEMFSFTAPEDAIKSLIAIALDNRPEIAQADLMIQRGLLEVVSTRNGLLPQLDFFANLGKTGYSTSLSGTNPKPGEEGSYDIQAGFIYELSRGRREERAAHQKAELNVTMRQQAMKNLEQLIKQEVINAFIEVNRTLQQIKATAATTEKQREKLRVEEVRFNVGKTTSFQVAQAQRDLTAAMIAEVSSAVEHQQAFTELLRASGQLLQRRQIVLNK
ncbi:MAG: TolC family protein [Candidatus Rifleibacteriota bacterium]